MNLEVYWNLFVETFSAQWSSASKLKHVSEVQESAVGVVSTCEDIG